MFFRMRAAFPHCFGFGHTRTLEFTLYTLPLTKTENHLTDANSSNTTAFVFTIPS